MAIQYDTVKKHFNQLADQIKALDEEQQRFVNHVVIDNYNSYHLD